MKPLLNATSPAAIPGDSNRGTFAPVVRRRPPQTLVARVEVTVVTLWFALQCLLAGVAAIAFWLLVVALVVTHVEERQRARHRVARHGPR